MRRRWARAAVILSLLWPLSVFPGSWGPGQPPEAPPALSGEPGQVPETTVAPQVAAAPVSATRESAFDGSELVSMDSAAALYDRAPSFQVVRLGTSAASGAGQDAAPAGPARLRVLRVEVTPTIAFARADVEPVGKSLVGGGPTEGPMAASAAASSAPVLWMTTAQGTIAALGGAVHAAAGSLVAREIHTGIVVTQLPSEIGLDLPADWMVAAFWAVFLTALGALFFPRFAGLGAWSLYARLAQSQVEHHPRRSLVLGLIRGRPGVSLVELERASQIEGGVLRHHLDQLERHGLVRRLREGRTTNWYPAGPRLPAHAPPTEAQQRVLRWLHESPGSTTRQVAQAIATSSQNAWKLLCALQRSERAVAQRRGRCLVWAGRAPGA